MYLYTHTRTHLTIQKHNLIKHTGVVLMINSRCMKLCIRLLLSGAEDSVSGGVSYAGASARDLGEEGGVSARSGGLRCGPG